MPHLRCWLMTRTTMIMKKRTKAPTNTTKRRNLYHTTRIRMTMDPPTCMESSFTSSYRKNVHSPLKSTRIAAYLLFGFLLAFCAVFSLIAVAVSLQWGKCASATDCRLGMTCVRFQDISGILNLPTCEDCSLFIGEDAANHKMPPNADALDAEEDCFNMSLKFYLERDYDGIYQDDASKEALLKEYPNTCLYMDYNTSRASRLDIFVLFMVISILAFHAGAEAIQQDRVERIRRYSMPLVLPGKSLASWQCFAATLLVHLSEIMQALLLANIPMTLTMLAISDRVGAVQLILDGLAVTFFFFVDDIASAMILNTNRKRAEVERYLGQLEASAKGRDGFHGTGDDRWVMSISTFFLCIFAYYGVQRANNCESIIYWLNYRVVVQFGVWFVSILGAIIRLCQYYFKGNLNGSDRMIGWKKRGYNFGLHVVKWFLYTLFAAFVQNTMFYFATGLYYDSQMVVSIRDYLWLYVKDLFGLCAGIAWDETFPCASPWPFPGDAYDEGLR